MSSHNNSHSYSNNSLSSELTFALRDAIISGEIAQGSRLSETHLAERFKVSRGPLREAIRRLEGMKLVSHKHQQGVRVVTLDPEFVLQIYDAREALESKAAALAAISMSSAEIDNLHRLLDAQTKQMRETDSARISDESDYIFHEMVIRGSGNTVIEHALLEEIYHLIKMFRYQSDYATYGNANSLIEHRQIVYAIEQRDAVLAEITMRRHIVHTKERIKKRFKKEALLDTPKLDKKPKRDYLEKAS